jgi:hypothetical protein
MSTVLEGAACPDLEPSEGAALIEVLETLAAQEDKIAEAFYPVFFERRPDAIALFGEYALAEREEMIRETLHSLLGLAEGERWLASNLDALGRSHFEYGVTGDMYADFVDAFVVVAAPGLTEAGRAILRRGLAQITRSMRRAGDEAAAAHRDRPPMVALRVD